MIRNEAYLGQYDLYCPCFIQCITAGVHAASLVGNKLVETSPATVVEAMVGYVEEQSVEILLVAVVEMMLYTMQTSVANISPVHS